MFAKAYSRSPRLLLLAGMMSIVGSAACDELNACAQFSRDLNERRKECGEEPLDSDGYPGGCTDVQARRSECFGDCLEDYPTCDALFISKPEGIAVQECWEQCLLDIQ